MAENTDPSVKFKRTLLKLSGEALLGTKSYGIDPEATRRFAEEIRDAMALGVQLCVVVGGGNIFRGLAGSARGMDRVKADYVGMLATIMNAICLENELNRIGTAAVVHTAIPVPGVAKSYQRDEAVADLEAGKVVIFAGGTGNPFFTTDTTAALRAAEMGCDAILKATHVDGVYSADPKTDPYAIRFEHLTYSDALASNLQVMDGAAFALARDSSIPIIVFSTEEVGSIAGVLRGQARSTLVTSK